MKININNDIVAPAAHNTTLVRVIDMKLNAYTRVTMQANPT